MFTGYNLHVLIQLSNSFTDGTTYPIRVYRTPDNDCTGLIDMRPASAVIYKKITAHEIAHNLHFTLNPSFTEQYIHYHNTFVNCCRERSVAVDFINGIDLHHLILHANSFNDSELFELLRDYYNLCSLGEIPAITWQTIFEISERQLSRNLTIARLVRPAIICNPIHYISLRWIHYLLDKTQNIDDMIKIVSEMMQISAVEFPLWLSEQLGESKYNEFMAQHNLRINSLIIINKS